LHSTQRVDWLIDTIQTDRQTSIYKHTSSLPPSRVVKGTTHTLVVDRPGRRPKGTNVLTHTIQTDRWMPCRLDILHTCTAHTTCRHTYRQTDGQTDRQTGQGRAGQQWGWGVAVRGWRISTCDLRSCLCMPNTDVCLIVCLVNQNRKNQPVHPIEYIDLTHPSI